MTNLPPLRQRTLADYRPQHDEDCGVKTCSVCRQDRLYCSCADAPWAPLPCSCGLASLLVVSGRRDDEQKNQSRSDQPQLRACESDQRGDDLSELEVQARHLATYAASVNWEPGDNTREWLLGLRDLIEHVQALTRPNGNEMESDLDLDHLDDECPSCGGSGEMQCEEDVCACVGGHPCPRCV